MTSSEKAVSLNGKPVHLGQPEVNQSESSVNSKNTLNDGSCSDVSVIDSSETNDSYTPNYEILNLIESDEFKKVEKHLLDIIEKQKLGKKDEAGAGDEQEGEVEVVEHKVSIIQMKN